MTCKEYYKEKYQIDISELHKDICNFIASNFLEHIYFSEEELKDFFKESKIEKSEKEEIVGGKADGKSVEDIAKKHNISVKEIEDQLKIGLEIEREHTDSKEKAEEISKDHLWEFPDYYTRLKQMEKEAEKDSLKKGNSDVNQAMKHPDKLGEGAKKRKGLDPKDKFHAVMKEFSRGTLHSGDGSKVTNKEQAIAIAYSESGLEKGEVSEEEHLEEYIDSILEKTDNKPEKESKDE